jgi:hypothetical protein
MANPATALGTPRAAPNASGIYAADEGTAILKHTEQLGDLREHQRHAIVVTLRYTGGNAIRRSMTRWSAPG